MTWTALPLVALFLTTQVVLPGLVAQHWAHSKGWLRSNTGLSALLFGLCWNLLASTAYRLAATPFDLSFLWFGLANLGFGYYVWRRWRLSRKRLDDYLTFHLLFRWQAEQYKGFLGLLAVLFIPTMMIFYYQVQPIQNYYSDELFRSAMANFVSAGLPIQDFLVYGGGDFHYYYLAEIYTANIAQLTGLKPVVVYFHFLLWHNWVLIAWALLALIGPVALKRPALAWFLVFFFFTLYGVAGPQRISHFTFKENTLALALMFMSLCELRRFEKTGETLRFAGPMVASWAIVFIKTIAAGPLGLVLVYSGIRGLLGGKIRLVPLALFGIGTLAGSYLILETFVSHPNAPPPGLVFAPEHGQIGRFIPAFSRWFEAPIAALKAYFGATWPWWRAALMPLLYSVEYLVLTLVGLGLMLWRRKRTDGLGFGLTLWLSGYLCMAAFWLFRFEDDSSSLAYFTMFGAWSVCAGSLILFANSAELLQGKSRWLPWVLLLGIWGFSTHSYQAADWKELYGPKSPGRVWSTELKMIKTLEQFTTPNSWIIHDQYKGLHQFLYVSLGARRSFASWSYGQATFQEASLYKKRHAQAKEFYSGSQSAEEQRAFLDRYQIDAVAYTEFSPEGAFQMRHPKFKQAFSQGQVRLWVRVPPLAR